MLWWICWMQMVISNYNINDINLNDESSDMIGIYCGAAYACQELSMTDNEKFIIQNFDSSDNYNNISQSFNIFCDVQVACKDLALLGADNIFCRATIHSMKNVFVTAEYGLGWKTVSNITGDIYCLAYQSCVTGSFSQVGGNVYEFCSEKQLQIVLLYPLAL